jgi:hypothetical protein
VRDAQRVQPRVARCLSGNEGTPPKGWGKKDIPGRQSKIRFVPVWAKREGRPLWGRPSYFGPDVPTWASPTRLGCLPTLRELQPGPS